MTPIAVKDSEDEKKEGTVDLALVLWCRYSEIKRYRKKKEEKQKKINKQILYCMKKRKGKYWYR